jgi:hypothetical protein
LGIELGNSFRLTDEVYRSQQPDDQTMAAQEGMGMRSILNLREYYCSRISARLPKENSQGYLGTMSM